MVLNMWELDVIDNAGKHLINKLYKRFENALHEITDINSETWTYIHEHFGISTELKIKDMYFISVGNNGNADDFHVTFDDGATKKIMFCIYNPVVYDDFE